MLYIVGTPIGNLGDITLRAAKTLEEVDFIAAEDTRVTIKLLNHLGINKPMISYHEHNIRQKGEEIVARMKNGEKCAIVTDAGMPCISDPGEDLVKLCYDNDISVFVIPGPSAVVSALALSGQATKRFTFEGFLSTSKTSRFSHLQELKDEKRTIIFYEAPHKLVDTLKDLLSVLGDRGVTVVKEMTKIHERVLKTNLSCACEYYKENKPRGEYVIVVEGQAKIKEHEFTLDEAVLMARELVFNGEKLTQACKIASQNTSIKKSDIYNKIANV